MFSMKCLTFAAFDLSLLRLKELWRVRNDKPVLLALQVPVRFADALTNSIVSL
jgi:hypothetical protein